MGKKLDKLVYDVHRDDMSKAAISVAIKRYAEEYAQLALQSATLAAKLKIQSEPVEDKPTSRLDTSYWDAPKFTLVEISKESITGVKLPKHL